MKRKSVQAREAVAGKFYALDIYAERATRYLATGIKSQGKDEVYGFVKSNGKVIFWQGHTLFTPLDCKGWDDPLDCDEENYQSDLPEGYRLLTDITSHSPKWHSDLCREKRTRRLWTPVSLLYRFQPDFQYARRAMTQEDYLREHQGSGLQVGDRVKIVRPYVTGEHSCRLKWNESLEPLVGLSGEIVRDNGYSGFIVNVDVSTNYHRRDPWPYFCLEKLQPNYRAFADAAEFAPHAANWIRPKGDDAHRDTKRVLGFGDDGVQLFGVGVISYEQLLADYEFCDLDDLGSPGEPCGIDLDFDDLT